jgi:hypothetical protein
MFYSGYARLDCVIDKSNSRNKISRDGGVAIFKALARHPNISTLILSKCSIQDEGAYAVNEFLLVNASLKKYLIF